MNIPTRASINKKNGSLTKLLMGTVAFFLFIFAFNVLGAEVKNVFYNFSSPLQKTFWTAGSSSAGFFNTFLGAGNLKKEKENLEKKNLELRSQIVAMQALLTGNEAQTKVSEACQGNDFQLLMAGVVGLDRPDVISIQKGSKDGITEGMPVLNKEGALFGKIGKVYDNFSEVILISNLNSVINAKVQQKEIIVDASNAEEGEAVVETLMGPEVNGVIKGLGHMNILFDLIPINDTIKEGDIITTSAMEGNFPKNILIGTVTKVQKNDQNPHQSAEVKPFLGPSVENLFVITNYKR